MCQEAVRAASGPTSSLEKGLSAASTALAEQVPDQGLDLKGGTPPRVELQADLVAFLRQHLRLHAEAAGREVAHGPGPAPAVQLHLAGEADLDPLVAASLGLGHRSGVIAFSEVGGLHHRYERRAA